MEVDRQHVAQGVIARRRSRRRRHGQTIADGPDSVARFIGRMATFDSAERLASPPDVTRAVVARVRARPCARRDADADRHEGPGRSSVAGGLAGPV